MPEIPTTDIHGRPLSPETIALLTAEAELRADPEKWAENKRKWANMRAKMQSSVSSEEPVEVVE